MKRRDVVLTAGAVGAAAMLQGQTPAAPPKTHLKVGDTAPDFKVPTTTASKSFQLSDYKGKSGVVVAFFPAAFTGGCTKEMTAYGNEIKKFQDMGFEVIGISTDNTPSLAYWAEHMLKVNAPLGSDFATRKTAEAYGVLMKDRGIANRATFVIDKEGKIVHIEEGSAAVDISGAANACARVKGKS
ncbi:redoxin domain-containing protein [Bryobacter aggregatus]|uniref:redoxin domain-containing protein n=1 Tax=Bryobacter aggregatus TaxID=360054 RepID=UPI00138E47A4|nr:redoxin domain-containing protein [Bryobacter aggregatus]